MKKKLKPEEQRTRNTKTHIFQKKNWPVHKPNSPLPLVIGPTIIVHSQKWGSRVRISWLKLSSSVPKFLERVEIQPTSPMTSLGTVWCWTVGSAPSFFFFFSYSDGMCLFILASVGGNSDTQKNHQRGGAVKVWRLTCSVWHLFSEAVPQNDK